MTGRSASRRTPGAGLLEVLLGVLRPQFRADVLTFAATDPVFGGQECAITGCPRTACGHGLCQGHRARWAKAGRPGLGQFIASTDPQWNRQQPNSRCRVDRCGYGVAGQGLCQLHQQKWNRSGNTDLAAWLDDAPSVKPPRPGAICRITGCDLWPQAALAFCFSHAKTWKANGRNDVDVFAQQFTQARTKSGRTVHLETLAPQLRLEVQYALQRRHDEPGTKTPPLVVMQIVRFLTASSLTSLLQISEEDLRTQARAAGKGANARALLVFARRQVEDLLDADGWEAEFPREVWQMRRLGFEGNSTLRFAPITQPWLRDLTKRWLRWRLGTGIALEVARRGLRSLTRFAGFLDDIGVRTVAGITRAVLERYLGDLHAELGGRPSHGDCIGQLSSFLQAVRQHQWDESLPAGAVVFSDDYPQRTEHLPRALSEQIMTQIEEPGNLARFADPAHRLSTLILIRCGLRVSDALSLSRDCVITDAEGAPYLRYLNRKMKRQALVPLDEELHTLISQQQARNMASPVLFPRPTKNPDHHVPISSSTYRLALYRWLHLCDVRDEHGHPVHLTPHQWRHTLGTRLINRDVPQEVVRRILDHDSPQMTAHYARLHDSTIRRHWEAARKIDINGQDIIVDPEGPLSEASWAKQRLGRATQALPNGFCGLPVQKTCPHANACLTCPMFITTEEFLPQHRGHRQQTLELITAAQARGQTRLVEMNQQVLSNLDRIITTLHTPEDAPTSPLSDPQAVPDAS